VSAPGSTKALRDEYPIFQALKQEVEIGKEYVGMMGFTAGTVWDQLFPDHDQGKDVYFQDSRQMTNLSRRYYERELGAGLGPNAKLNEMFGHTEPLRRFIQREGFEPQANEIANTMPSWLPGDDYMTNFKVGDPYVRIDDGYARLPGAGYEALHPELKGVDPEEYPDIHKLRILADVATPTLGLSVLPQHKSLARTRCGGPPFLHPRPAFSEAHCGTQKGHTRVSGFTLAMGLFASAALCHALLPDVTDDCESRFLASAWGPSK
jgi:hypothetical protein